MEIAPLKSSARPPTTTICEEPSADSPAVKANFALALFTKEVREQWDHRLNQLSNLSKKYDPFFSFSINVKLDERTFMTLIMIHFFHFLSTLSFDGRTLLALFIVWRLLVDVVGLSPSFSLGLVTAQLRDSQRRSRCHCWVGVSIVNSFGKVSSVFLQVLEPPHNGGEQDQIKFAWLYIENTAGYQISGYVSVSFAMHIRHAGNPQFSTVLL